MDKEVLSSSQDGVIPELSVLAHRSNKHSTKIKQKIRILDHPKNIIEVLRARLAIKKGLIGNDITTGPKQVPLHQDLPRQGNTAHLRPEGDRTGSGDGGKFKDSNEPRCNLIWPQGVSLQAEAVLALQDDQASQADHEAVCGLGPRPQFKDGSVATSL